MQDIKLIYNKSPLNYTGGKYKLLNQILPYFPQKIEKFYDIFCGGANVIVNVEAKELIGADINNKVISLFVYFKNTKEDVILNEISNVIRHYGLSESNLNSYESYGCNSSDGLGVFNKIKYAALRNDYNSENYIFEKNIMFFVLVVFGFNNQIRFNSQNKFNIPVGKRDFNEKTKANLEKFLIAIKTKNISFINKSYKEIEINEGFVYADPPYLISNATYNESGGWCKNKELELLNYLKNLNDKGVKFLLSNVLEHKGMKNEILDGWIKENGFNLIEISHSYKNSSYNIKKNDTITREVLINNY